MQSQIPLWLEWLRKLPLERMIREGFEEETTILQYVFVAKRSQNAVSKPLLLDVDRISRIISAFVIGLRLFLGGSNCTFLLKFQDPGVIVLFGPSGGGGTEDATADFDDEEESGGESTDSECDVNRPVSPCNFTFIGANAKGAGKSSLRGGQLKRKKVGCLPASVRAQRERVS